MKLRRILQGFAIVAIILTLTPIIPIDAWWIRMFDFPHIQLTIITLAALTLFFIKFNVRKKRDYFLVISLIGCLLLQAKRILPYTFVAPLEMGDFSDIDAPEFSIFTANVLQTNTSYEKLESEIESRNPNLIVLTETNALWKNEMELRISAKYPHSILVPQDDTYGMLLYSQFPIINSSVENLTIDTVPSIHAQIILPSLDTIQVYAIHPPPPVPQHAKSSLGRDAEMMQIALLTKASKHPVLVLGDFNDVAWSESTYLFQRVSGLLDLRKGRGMYNTYNADNFLLRWPLDHIFASPQFSHIKMELVPDIDSDHFPIYAKFSFEPEREKEQMLEPTTLEEMEKALKEINKMEKYGDQPVTLSLPYKEFSIK